MSKQDYIQLTFFQEDSPASRSLQPGSEEAKKMTVTSGMKCCELLKNSDPLGSLAKMLLGSSLWRSRMVNYSRCKTSTLKEMAKATFCEYYRLAVTPCTNPTKADLEPLKKATEKHEAICKEIETKAHLGALKLR